MSRYWGLEWILRIHQYQCCFSLTIKDLSLLLGRQIFLTDFKGHHFVPAYFQAPLDFILSLNIEILLQGLQRFCTEHKIKLSKIDHIFLSRVRSVTAGGLPDLLLTLAGMGEEGMSVNVLGPTRSEVFG